ncbi:hypothetical protein AMJ49_03290 [Parcubacteria bacterium DG_74_2]|nr:MAG: hypothetical protein AMJ49_03290 [Parcubacteria bacterium DG_74_2]
MFEIREIKDKKTWEDFLAECDEKTFLNSWNWGEFNKTMGDKIWRLGIYQQQELIGVVFIIKISAKRGTFLFLPHGPNLKRQATRDKRQVLKILLEELKKIAKEEKATFIRIAPIWERNEENIKIFKELDFKEAPIHMHPELTWELSIEKPEEEILKEMRKTTRYLIRQGLKNKDVEISKSKKLEDVETFNKLYQETVDRHNFVPFSFDYLKNEFLVFLTDDQIMIFLGKYKGEVVSSAMVVFWQKIAFYHQGASSSKYPKIPVSYLLQWEAIKEAKKRGCRLYNFWGIAPTEDPKHPWAGLTLFKKGFGGYKKEYVKTQDLSRSKNYWLSFLVEKLRSKKRGF